MALFGIYSRAQPLVQLVVMVAGAAAAALVPGLALAQNAGGIRTAAGAAGFCRKNSMGDWSGGSYWINDAG